MGLAYCPHCNVRVTFSRVSGEDFVHECNSGDAVFDEEDVVITSVTVDEFGVSNVSTGKLSGDITRQGMAASNFGNRSWIEGDTVKDYTVRGNNSEITRKRQFYEYIPDIKKLSRGN